MDNELIVKILSVVSAGLGIVGAFLHAVDMFRGPIRWMDQVYFPRNAERSSDMQLERIIAINNALPQPPYTPEMIDDLNEGAEANHEERLRSVQRRKDDRAFKEAQYSLGYGIRGMVCIGLAFALQLIILAIQ